MVAMVMSVRTTTSVNVPNPGAVASGRSFATSHVTIPATKWNAGTFVRAAHKYPTRRPRP